MLKNVPIMWNAVWTSFWWGGRRNMKPVSYTHLDVYKRQILTRAASRTLPTPLCYVIFTFILVDEPLGGLVASTRKSCWSFTGCWAEVYFYFGWHVAYESKVRALSAHPERKRRSNALELEYLWSSDRISRRGYIASKQSYKENKFQSGRNKE